MKVPKSGNDFYPTLDSLTAFDTFIVVLNDLFSCFSIDLGTLGVARFAIYLDMK